MEMTDKIREAISKEKKKPKYIIFYDYSDDIAGKEQLLEQYYLINGDELLYMGFYVDGEPNLNDWPPDIKENQFEFGHKLPEERK